MIAPLRRLHAVVALLAATTLIATPTLCLAHVLVHECECADSAEICDCPDGCGDGCSHDGCGGDPCQPRVTSRPDGRDELELWRAGLATWSALRALCRRASPRPLDVPPPRGHSTFGPDGRGKRIPFHVSDIPLLD